MTIHDRTMQTPVDAARFFIENTSLIDTVEEDNSLFLTFRAGDFSNTICYHIKDDPANFDLRRSEFYEFFSSFFPYLPPEIDEIQSSLSAYKVESRNTLIFVSFNAALFDHQLKQMPFNFLDAFPKIVFDFESNIPPVSRNLLGTHKIHFPFTVQLEDDSLNGTLELFEINDKFRYHNLFIKVERSGVDVSYTFLNAILVKFLKLCYDHSFFLPHYMKELSLYNHLQTYIESSFIELIRTNDFYKFQQLFNPAFPELKI